MQVRFPFTFPHFIAGACLFSGAFLAATPQDDLPERLAELGQAAARANGGVSMVVLLGSDELVSRGFGYADAARSQPATADSAYRAGSLTLQLVSIAAVDLIRREELDPSAKVAELFTELEGRETEFGAVEVRHLLDHTSGLTDYSTLLRPAELRAGPAPEVLLERLAEVPLEFEPGSCFSYSETNLFLLGWLVERAVETELADYFDQRIFKPLELEDTVYCFDGPPIYAQAGACQEVPGGVVSMEPVAHPFSAAGLCTSAADLARLQRGLVERELLDEDGLEWLTREALTTDGEPTHYSAGFNRTRVGDVEGWSYGGGMVGGRVHVAWYPAMDLVIAVAAAGEDAPVRELERRAARAVLGLPEPGVQDLAVSEEVGGMLTGTYNIGCSSYVVRRSGERLIVLPPDGPVWTLLYQDQLEFVARHDPEVRLVFHVEEGRAEAFTLHEHGTESRARRLQ